MKKVLIVEDDARIAFGLQNFLETEGYEIVDILSDAEAVVQKVLYGEVDLILMDINLKDKPGDISGLTQSKKIREYKQTPVIFITSLEKKDIMKRTLEIENSAFLIKPWREIELLSCINRLTKTTKTIKLDNDFCFKNGELFKNDAVIHLNHQESKLLKFFIENRNKLLTHEQIEDAVWGNSDKQITRSTKIALISKLKSKLEKRFITTVPKSGYKFVVNQKY